MKRLPSAPLGMRAVSDLIQPEDSGGRADDATGSAEIRSRGIVRRALAPIPSGEFWSSPELCVKVRGSSSMLLLGCLGDLLRFEKREIQVATFAPDRSSP